ncbi:hypothetical protein [Phenylobacterium sp.]|uniref:hypothetical protein n=1 Tax=Phenylobacterium sp. TaxID=1871053 RepID=UPI0035AF4147
MKPSRRVAAPIAALRVGLCLGAAMLAAGCAGASANPFAAKPLDPNSPIAPEAAKAAAARGAFPKFSDIPKKPTDDRSPKAWGQAAAKVEAARDKLVRETAPDTWSLGGTAAFAGQAANTANADTAPNANSDAEAFARAARERATPPPSPR